MKGGGGVVGHSDAELIKFYPVHMARIVVLILGFFFLART